MSTHRGFTLIELMLVVAIIGVLWAIALPAYNNYQDRGDIAIAISDISVIELAINRFWAEGETYPDSLLEINIAMNDPWGSPYYYFNISLAKGKGSLRKDKNLVPINTDFDLYSAGKDGKTVSPLTAKSSQDDIVRANNGNYIGLAEDF